jgi:hypothetical protein
MVVFHLVTTEITAISQLSRSCCDAGRRRLEDRRFRASGGRVLNAPTSFRRDQQRRRLGDFVGGVDQGVLRQLRVNGESWSPFRAPLERNESDLGRRQPNYVTNGISEIHLKGIRALYKGAE